MAQTEFFIRAQLLKMQDPDYRKFQQKLLPTLPPERIIGVRTPFLRQMARELAGTPEAEAFCRMLPHDFFEENNLHGFLLERIRTFDAALEGVEAFLPYVDNWATCDGFAPRVFQREPQRLMEAIRRWIASGKTYTVRYGLGMLMRYYLDEEFRPEYLEMAAAVRSEEYYIRMMVAWFFATALAKQPEAAWPYLAEPRLDPWVRNKAIQKACESRRISARQKDALRALRESRGDARLR